MQTVDRDQFLAYVEEGLLLKVENGKLLIVDELMCEKALKELESGNKIAFTVDGNIVSFMQLVNNEYVESLE